METLWEVEERGWRLFLTVKVEKSSSSFLFITRKAFTPFLTQLEACLALNAAPKESCWLLYPFGHKLTVVSQVSIFSCLLEMIITGLSQDTVRTNELIFVEACGNVKCSVLFLSSPWAWLPYKAVHWAQGLLLGSWASLWGYMTVAVQDLVPGMGSDFLF